jgi:ABC transport system ATP-binding/permease protein
MNESVLKALMRLFAIVASVTDEGQARNERDVVVEYLQRQFSKELVEQYLGFFDDYLREYHTEKKDTMELVLEKKNQNHSNAIDDLCQNLNKELEQSQKMLVVLYLLDFINKGEPITEKELEFVSHVAKDLNIPVNEFEDAVAFSFDQLDKIKGTSNLLYITNGPMPHHKKSKHLSIDKLDGLVKVFHIASTNTYVLRYVGPMTLLLNGHHIRPNRTYIWASGSVLKNPRFGSIYYTWIAGRFIQAISATNFVFEARNIAFAYGNSPNGIKIFNMNEESGRLIGIIGGSGSGKSTLLKLLSGIIKPKRGKILINGFDIHKNHEELKGVIGYVPQDDVLIKELTVFENLYYNARLSFSDYSEEEISKVVDEALLSFDLVEARDLQVGDAFSTFLSGGQRKRLNIALELIREPALLFVDEPTSGLSSADSEKVMHLLKRQTFKGKLVFANIHQPSSEIFKLLDKLLVVDQGGRVIYYGNPLDAIGYFKRASHFVDAEESECLTCGNIDADQILRNVEARVVDVNGRLTRKRKITPQEWYSLYKTKIDPNIRQIKRPYTSSVPESLYRIPGRWQQIKIFFKRDIWAKLKNDQYLIVTILEAPILALLLSFYTRSSRNLIGLASHYQFGLNENLPAYLFMAVIVALFLGLVISAEEIFRDRKILERERFLSLSRVSYLFSKITIMFIISAVQMLLFVIIGNTILEIKMMNWRFFLVLFSASCWANLIGLNISAGFKSIVTIYILVPLILVPQLLFSGVVVDFHNLNKAIYSAKYVPAIGEAMTSRWAYEAMVVTQFKDNNYEKNLFASDQVMSESMYEKSILIPQIRKMLDEIWQNSQNGKAPMADDPNIILITNEFRKLESKIQSVQTEFIEELQNGIISTHTYKNAVNFLDNAWSIFHAQYLKAVADREEILRSISLKNHGIKTLKELSNIHANKKLSSVVKNDQELYDFVIFKNEIVRLRDPIFTLPWSNNGRAHFYAPYKKIAGLYIDTFWFNILVIWVFTGLWFVILYFDLLRKLIKYFENNQLQRFNNRIFKILRQYEVRQ